MATVGQNVDVTLKDNILTIKVDLSKGGGRSKSGKSTIIGTTNGNVIVPGNEAVRFGLNVYQPV